jgi:uncharacterized LabA/DUF88 family protein
VSKNVAVFVDVANIFYAAKAAGADIDYVTLLKAAVSGRDFVRAYAYTGLDPENENQRNFHSFLARHGYKVVSKDIRKYGDGKVKANLDIELVVDMMKTARNLDVAIVVSGDGDFAPAIRAVQEMGVRVEVISFRGNTSSDLIEVADAFYDITSLARVDRESSRSGRRVADDDQDLSMTEVPDKQTEGRGGGRGRGRGRGTGRGRGEGIEETAVADSRRAPRVAAAAPSGGRLLALPGEKLSRAGAAAAAAADELADGEPLEDVDTVAAEGGEDAQLEQGGTRRRRRRGGRGRGHGRRGFDEAGVPIEGGETDDEESTPSVATPKTNQFGSVWDSQIGMSGRPERLTAAPADEDDFAEPEIPEYLLAERRRSNAGGRGRGQGGGRGVRSAYASAVERERFGGRSPSRYPEPARQPQPQPQRHRDDRPVRGPQPQRGGNAPRGRSDSNEPWSEVPPEIEELLRAQLSTKVSRSAEQGESNASAPAEVGEDGTTIEQPKRGRGRGRGAASAAANAAAEAGTTEGAETGADGEAPAPKKRAPSRRKAAVEGDATDGEASAASAETGVDGEAPAPKKRAPSRRKAAVTAETSGESASEPSTEGSEQGSGE